jgi:serine/threonine protein kinase
MIIAERFAIESLIGKGGMGEVYRARDLASGEMVALKLVELDESDASERFAREARLLCSLHHPRIVRYIAHGVARGQRYLAMEWLEGEDLAHRLTRTGLTPAQSAELVARVAEGLQAVHAHGIVHRDVKPSNLILPDGDIERVKIIDFGVARPIAGAPMLTTAGDPVGTPNYMSPEQARGDPDIDVRADLFALGCVLFECLTGRPPFSATSGLAVMAKILFEEPPRLSEVAPGLAILDERGGCCARPASSGRRSCPAASRRWSAAPPPRRRSATG